MPSGKRSSLAWATSIASRLLPIPPGPIRLTTRLVAAREQIADGARRRPRGRSSSCRGRGCARRADAARLVVLVVVPRPGLVESFGEEGGEVVGDAFLEFFGGLEGEVGGGVVGRMRAMRALRRSSRWSDALM